MTIRHVLHSTLTAPGRLPDRCLPTAPASCAAARLSRPELVILDISDARLGNGQGGQPRSGVVAMNWRTP